MRTAYPLSLLRYDATVDDATVARVQTTPDPELVKKGLTCQGVSLQFLAAQLQPGGSSPGDLEPAQSADPQAPGLGLYWACTVCAWSFFSGDLEPPQSAFKPSYCPGMSLQFLELQAW